MCKSKDFSSTLDAFSTFICTASILGIWPRFIEPNCLSVSHLKLSIPHLPKALEGLTLLHFSDLHFYSGTSRRVLQKIQQELKKLRPDLVFFTGDFLCYSQLLEMEKLQQFLHSFSAPHGCFAVLGNHDYAKPVSVNDRGEYDVVEKSSSAIVKGLKRLFVPPIPSGKVTERARDTPFHSELLTLLKASPFQLLHNETQCVPIKDSALNVTGLGEYMLDQCKPSAAFQTYDARYPGIILSHNPDSFPLLKSYPGQLILSGHTHGGQVNLPFIWKRYACVENLKYALGGLFQLEPSKWLYVNRGVGSIFPLRWRAKPEILHITLKAKT